MRKPRRPGHARIEVKIERVKLDPVGAEHAHLDRHRRIVAVAQRQQRVVAALRGPVRQDQRIALPGLAEVNRLRRGVQAKKHGHRRPLQY